VKKLDIPKLLRAFAQAEGSSDQVSKGGAMIKRVNPEGKEVQIKVNVKDIFKGK
jgi:hypothetical protein